MEVDEKETYKQAEQYKINEILAGVTSIARAYNELIASGPPMRNAGGHELEKYRLEVGAVYSAGQLLGYFAGAGIGPTIDLNAVVPLTCGVGLRSGQSRTGSSHGPQSYAGLSALLNAQQTPAFVTAFQSMPASKGIVADLETTIAQISNYGCSVYNITPASTEDGQKSAFYAFQGLNDAAQSGYELGFMQGQTAAALGCTRGGSSKKKRGGRRKNMRGGALSKNTQLNLLTTALILGGVGGAYAAGAGAMLYAGLEFCYQQGRSILYSMNWLKRPCVTDTAIISGLLFKSIPGLGANALTCLEIAEQNQVMNKALALIVSSVYSAAIGMGMKKVTGSDIMRMPGALFAFVKQEVSTPMLEKLQFAGSLSYNGIIGSFRLIADGYGRASEAVRDAAAKIAQSLQSLSCPPDKAADDATVAAAVLTTTDASVLVSNGEASDDITPEQQKALEDVLANISPDTKAAFIEAVQRAAKLSKLRAKYNLMVDSGNKAAEAAEGDQAAKQAAGAAAFVTAFIAEADADVKKQIFTLMDDKHKDFVRQSGQVDMSTLQGGRRRRRKTVRRRNKKRKTKTMRKKKIRGRKAKRKTKGKKSKARRKTRSYRR